MAKRIAILLVAILVLVTALYLVLVFSWAYSSGERAGWVQKFSRKGWICKTWEGELVLVTLPGTLTEKFPFTVHDAAVARQIELAVGQRVLLHYEQHRGVPGSCFGDSEYWVDGVTAQPLTAPPAAIPAVPAPAPAPTPR